MLILKPGFFTISTAPARGLNDFDSLSYRGFECFHLLLKWFHPRFFLHGHIHKNYGMHIPQITRCGQTTVVNAFEYCRINFEQQERGTKL